MCKISIIIPAYNVERWINACVASIKIADCEGSIECVIVDDGSTDNTGVICDKLSRGHDMIKVLHTDNRGVSAARNAGIEMSNGNWIIFLDADDEMIPGWYETVKIYLDNYYDLFVFGHIRKNGKDNGKHIKYSCVNGTKYNIDRLLLTTSELNSSCSKIYKKKSYN